jgi:hypothetical protein
MSQTNSIISKVNLGEEMKKAGIHGAVKMVSMPISKNKILVRLENLADLYDGAQQPAQVSNSFAQALFNSANLLPKEMNIEFRELSLSGNMDIQEMLDRKIKWKTVDDNDTES